MKSLTLGAIAPTIDDGGSFDLPEMIPVKQRFTTDRVDDVEAALRDGIAGLGDLDLHGKKIAITAGSRGIKDIFAVLRTTVEALKARGAKPFLIPAMGSHGGATADGQLSVLKKIGITEDAVGAPIHASMDVVELGVTAHGLTVYCDKLAYEADGIVVCNRIKVHPVFKADYESGVAKMMVIGLGKHKGAVAAHQLGFDRFHEIIPEAAALTVAKAPILFGIGLVDNAFGKLASVSVMRPEEIVSREPELLRYAKEITGRLLMSAIDVLIVDFIGKDISGGGMDANVTGRSALGLPGFVAPPIQRIIIRDLTPATAGSAIGIGLADFTTRRCAEKIDLAVTYTNAMTALALQSPKIPLIAETDFDALGLALRACPGIDPAHARIVQIKNTKDLNEIWMSTAYKDEIDAHPDLDAMGPPRAFAFDADGTQI